MDYWFLKRWVCKIRAQHEAGSGLSEDPSIPFDRFCLRKKHITKFWPTELDGEGVRGSGNVTLLLRESHGRKLLFFSP